MIRKFYFFSLVVEIGIILITSQVAKAEVTLLDASKLPVGTILNENLVVQEKCLQPTSTDCLASEKIKYITGMPGKIGQIKFDVNLTDNFEINMKVIWESQYPRSALFTYYAVWGEKIVLYKSNQENNSLAIEFEHELTTNFHFPGILRIVFSGEGLTYAMSKSIFWKYGNINHIKLAVQNGIATLSINESSFVNNSCGYFEWTMNNICRKDTLPDSITLNTSEPYTKLVIDGIQEIDSLLALSLQGAGTMEFEAGRQTCIAHPASCGITLPRENPPAVYNPITGEAHLPIVNILDSFGNSQSSYEVYLLQQPGLFTFDLDMSRLKPIYSDSNN